MESEELSDFMLALVHVCTKPELTIFGAILGCFWKFSWNLLFSFSASNVDADIECCDRKCLFPGKFLYVIVGDGALLVGEFEFRIKVGCLVGSWTKARCAVPLRLLEISCAKLFNLEPTWIEGRVVADDKTLLS